MSDVDDAIRRELSEQLNRLQVPTQGRAATARSDLRRSRRRRTFIAAAGAAVIACAITSFLVLTRGQPDHTPEPATHLRVLRTLSASSLGIAKPAAAAIGPNGNLYIADSGHQTITEASPEGKVIRRWGGPGARDGRFRLADSARIAIDNQGRVYVADSGNGRVQVFTGSGRFIRQIGTLGSGAGQFLSPTAVAVGPDGSVYVSDDTLMSVTKLSPIGHQEWRLGGIPAAPATPADLLGHTHFGSLDSHGRLVVANDDTSRIVYISAGGKQVDGFGHGTSHDQASDFPQGACDTTVDSNGYVYVAGCIPTKSKGNLIQIYDPNHRLVGAWPHSPLITAPRFGPGNRAVSVGFGSILELAVEH